MCHIGGMAIKEEYIKTRVSRSSKVKAERIIHSLGLDMSSYLRLCLYQLIRDKAIPFKPHLEIDSYEDILMPAKKRQAVLDYIDEE